MVVWILNFRTVISSFYRYRWSLIPFVVYFLLQLASVLRGPIVNHEKIKQKLMFILLPLLCLPVFLSVDEERKLEFQFRSFLTGIFVVFVFLLIRAAINSIAPGGININPAVNSANYGSAFQYDNFSYYAHPTFLSIKVLFAILILIHYYVDKQWLARFKYPLAALLFVFMVLLSSKTAFVAAFAYLVFYIIGALKKHHLSGRSKIATIIVLMALITSFMLNYRIREFIRPLWDPNDGISIREAVTSVPRYRQWISSCHLICENWCIGVGLSNSRNELSEKYLENGFMGEYELSLDAHNQFLEELLTNGIPGIIILFWMLYRPFFRHYAFRQKKLTTAFIIIFTASAFFESMFNRQWGIMFFMLFYCILLFTPNVEAGTAVSKQD
jgi:O-antigen ligase